MRETEILGEQNQSRGSSSVSMLVLQSTNFLCRYRSVVLRPDEDIVIVISQSGETADTLAALRHAKEAGCLVLGIVNTVCQLPNSAHISQSCPESGYDFQAKHRPSKVFRLLHSHTHPHPLNSLTHKRTQTPRRPAASSSASSTR